MPDDRSLPPWACRQQGCLCIRLQVVPGARRSEIVGLHGDRLKLRVAAPPEDGAANAAVIALLEARLGRGTCTLIQGHSQRRKVVALAPGVDPAALG